MIHMISLRILVKYKFWLIQNTIEHKIILQTLSSRSTNTIANPCDIHLLLLVNEFDQPSKYDFILEFVPLFIQSSWASDGGDLSFVLLRRAVAPHELLNFGLDIIDCEILFIPSLPLHNLLHGV